MCLLAVMGTIKAWGLAWHYSRIELLCDPPEAGYVYASTASAGVDKCTTTTYTGVYGRTANSSFFPCPWYIYTKPVDSKKYKFVKWECVLRQGDVTSYWGRSATAVGTTYTSATPGKIYAALSKALGTPNTGNKSEIVQDPKVVNARWVAHYELLESHDITVACSNDALGSVAITGPDGTAENKVGDVVTITMRTSDYTTMFLGWKYNGEWVRDDSGNIIRDPSYAFTVTNENKGEYVAQFEGGYTFFRIKNRKTGHYITSPEYFPGGSGYSGLKQAMETFRVNDDLSSSLNDQGSVVRWTSYPRPSSVDQIVNVVEIRGVSTEQYYKVSDGTFLYMTHNADNSYDIGYSSNSSLHLVEKDDGTIMGSGTATASMNYLWDFEGIDKDLTTKENYYTPAGLVQNEANGLWYSTHRSSWNTMYDTNEITAYVLDGITENGLMRLIPVTGGIIPAGLPVLLECKSDDVTRNVMIPTLAAATFSVATNEMTSAEYYYPNQPAPTTVPSGKSYFALGTTSDGRVGFVDEVTDTDTGFHGNFGYYLGENEVVITFPSATLGSMLESISSPYKIENLTAVALAGNGSVIIAKDNAALELPATAAGEVDYMDMVGLARANNNRNNWVMLRVPDGQDAGTVIEINKKLANVQGRLVNAVNPEVQLDLMPQSADVDGYTPNTYIPASFYGTQVSPVNEKTYFFVQPQPMEYAIVKWALWDGTQFTTVPITGHSNAAGLQGSFSIDDRYLTNGTVDNLVSGHIYSMEGIAMVNGGTQAGAPALRAPGAAGYTFYPFTISQKAESVVTAVDDLNAADVVDVTYYDVTGLAAAVPHNGVNIVVTRHSDGTVTTTKVVR